MTPADLASLADSGRLTLPQVHPDEVVSSRIVESVLLRLPLPVVICSVRPPAQISVRAGAEVVAALVRFVSDQSMRLVGTEFDHGLDGLTFDELPIKLRLRARKAPVPVWEVDSRADDKIIRTIAGRAAGDFVPSRLSARGASGVG